MRRALQPVPARAHGSLATPPEPLRRPGPMFSLRPQCLATPGIPLPGPAWRMVRVERDRRGRVAVCSLSVCSSVIPGGPHASIMHQQATTGNISLFLSLTLSPGLLCNTETCKGWHTSLGPESIGHRMEDLYAPLLQWFGYSSLSLRNFYIALARSVRIPQSLAEGGGTGNGIGLCFAGIWWDCPGGRAGLWMRLPWPLGPAPCRRAALVDTMPAPALPPSPGTACSTSLGCQSARRTRPCWRTPCTQILWGRSSWQTCCSTTS